MEGFPTPLPCLHIGISWNATKYAHSYHGSLTISHAFLIEPRHFRPLKAANQGPKFGDLSCTDMLYDLTATKFYNVIKLSARKVFIGSPRHPVKEARPRGQMFSTLNERTPFEVS